MNRGQQVILFLSSGFYLGRLPVAPGTFGSLPGLGLWLLLSRWEWLAILFFLVIFILFAAWIAGLAAEALDCRDPGSVVIDEIAGMAITMAGIPINWTACVAGFVLFRFFDIAKPFPIRWVDQHVKGGFGIVLDDVLAGIISNIALRIIIKLIDFIL
ncbi:MAG: phosphatidylglycerophosphatase A [Deltaproteobacteria bacterium]|jgi:phosphatidylglycerophosphatase A